MQTGSKVRCTANRAYERHLTLGAEYTVVEFIPAITSAHIGWLGRDYVVVVGDLGEHVTAHATRFKEIKDET